jgi:hypothetical protein
MQSLSDWTAVLSTVNPAVWLAAGSGLVVILVLVLVTRRRRVRGPVVLPSDPVGSPDWESAAAATARHDERRRAIRRGGLPTPIYIVDARGGRKARATEAYVLDRSTGGLRLALEASVPVGGALLAKPSNAPDGFEWVRMTIRSCREVGDYYEVGCQFDQELELSRLLMFG